MFSLLPYPPAPDVPPAGPFPETDPGTLGGRLCLVADSSLAGGPLAQYCGRLAAGAAAFTLVDTATVPGAVPDGIGVIRLKERFSAQHGFVPLVSLCAYHWLAAREQELDLVLFADGFGAGHYSVTAKALGLAFRRTGLAVLAGSCHARELERARRFPQGRTDIERDFLERRTLELADAVIATDPDFPGWCGRAGWALPARRLAWPAPSLALPPPAPPAPAPPRPLVSVCIATFNRPGPLRSALASLLRQSYPRFEVVVVDDGSTDPGVAACLAEFGPRFRGRGWTVVRQSNAGPGAARNAAVRRAAGEYVLFMDDDNLALAHEIERFVTAALASGADVLTCIPGRHPDTTVGPAAVAVVPTPDPDHPLCAVDWTPTGASLALCAMINCLGDGNALYRRSVFEALGGFSESPHSFEDLRLLMLAVVRGYRLEVVPEVLFLYRRHQDSRSMGGNLFECHVDVLGPLTELVPRALWPLLLAVHGDWYQRHLGKAGERTPEPAACPPPSPPVNSG